MAIIQLGVHVSELIFGAIKQMVIAHKFTYNPDLSDTEKGTMKKQFKLRLAEAANTGRTNTQAIRLLGLFEITLFHNAEGNTEQGLLKVTRDVENLIFELERFAPTAPFDEVHSKHVETTNLLNWTTEPIKVGEDSRLRTVIQYEIGYKVSNPSN